MTDGIKNQKGSTMVEAAVLFPIVILAVTAVLCILLFFTRQVLVQAGMHISLRAAAGEEMKTVSADNDRESRFSMYEGTSGTGKTFFCEGYIKMNGSGLLNGFFQKKLNGRIYRCREIDFIRKQDIIEGIF